MSAKVALTQFIFPGGRREVVHATVSDEQAARAADMVLTCEVLPTGPIAIYGRYTDDEEEDEFCSLASNHAGPRQPDIVVGETIDAVWKRRHQRQEAS